MGQFQLVNGRRVLFDFKFESTMWLDVAGDPLSEVIKDVVFDFPWLLFG